MSGSFWDVEIDLLPGEYPLVPWAAEYWFWEMGVSLEGKIR